MRKLWLVFAQAVTLTLAVLFVVSLVKPDWLAWRAQQVVEVREAAPAPASAMPLASGRPLSFSEAAKKAIAYNRETGGFFVAWPATRR